jgi:hypothetical protein
MVRANPINTLSETEGYNGAASPAHQSGCGLKSNGLYKPLGYWDTQGITR